MSMAFVVKQILWGVLIPATVSGVIFLALRRFLGLWVSAVGIALGYFLAHRALYSLRDFSPNLSISDWLPYVALIALAWVLLEKLWWHFTWQGFAWVRWLMRLFLVEIMATRFFWTKLTHRLERFRWEWYESVFYLGMTALVVLAIWFFLEQRSLRDAQDEQDNGGEGRARAIFPSALVLYFTLFSGCTLFLHEATSAQQLGILTATIGAMMVLCWFNPTFRLPVPTVGVISIMLMPFFAYFILANIPWYTVLLFTAAPATLLFPLPEMPLLARTATRLALIAVPTALATALTFFFVY